MSNSHFVPTRALHDPFVLGQVSHGVGSAAEIVLGAPGVGKTSALIGRFLALVQSGVLPEQILVLAATRESAARLRDRIVLELAALNESRGGDPIAAVEGPMARTVSSVAFSIVRHHALENGLKAPELISGAEQDAILATLLEAHEDSADAALWPPHVSKLTRSLTGFRAELRDFFAVCQSLGIDSKTLSALPNGRAEWRAVAAILGDYEETLEGPNYEQRFDPMALLEAAEVILRSEQSGEYFDYRAILVDDAQELTGSGFIEALLGSQTSLTLYGDPDASTLAFRQANPQVMFDLAKSVSETRGTTVTLRVLEEDPWGKPAGLGEVAPRVTSKIPVIGESKQRKAYIASAPGKVQAGSGDAQDDKADARKAPSAGVVAKVFSSKQSEIEYLARSLRELHVLHHVEWQEMAVVARTRQVLDELELALAAESVPVRVLGAQNALRNEFAARELLDLALMACDELEVDVAVAQRLINSPFCGLDSVELRRLRRELRREESMAGGNKSSDELLVDLFANPNSLETIQGREARKVRYFLKSLAAAKVVAADPMQTIEDLLWALWKPSGLAATWQELSRGIGEVAVQANRNLDAVVALFAAANRYVERNPAADKRAFIAAQLDQAIAEDSLTFSHQGNNVVNLLTPAGLVGRRFHTVAIPQLIEGVWPNLKPRSTLLGANQLAERAAGATALDPAAPNSELPNELRMFYKAIGAANQQVLVTSFVHEEEQVSQFLGLVSNGIPDAEDFEFPAFTLRGEAGRLRRELAKSSDAVQRAKFAANLARLAQAGVPGASPADWYGLAPLSTTEPLFVFTDDETAEGSDSGKRIKIYPSALENFLKCPLHWFLENHGAKEKNFDANVGTLIHQALEVAQDSSEATLWSLVESNWHTLNFESAWIEQKQQRQAQKLVRNLAVYLANFEASGGKVLSKEEKFTFALGNAVIEGRIDRIEQTPDGNVVIADLKTGKQVTSKDDTKLHPQLGLYQLAYKHGALADLIPVEGNVDLGGAKLLFVSGDSATERQQEGLTEDNQKYFEDLVWNAAEQMAMPDKTFVAKVSSHCDVDSEFGTCHLHLVKAVSYFGQ
jgi:superfamily I DNA/RNA helicase/RecB family exonuclease